ncbi:MAG: thioester reductase domain-containing protein [Myxococcota bacterium]
MDLKQRIEQLEPAKRLALLRKLRSSGHPVALTWARDLSARDAMPDLALEAYLEPGIRPGAEPARGKRALLTGATGFLGAFLLRELTRDPRRRVVALVRDADAEVGAARVRDNVARYGLADEVDLSRVSVVAGRLDALRFGLDEAAFRTLADDVDVVYHSGALLNFLYGYQPFIGPNVVGTQEVLRLACTGRAKPVHHVSTVFFFMSGPHAPDAPPVDEHTARREPPRTWGGYAQSKWVSERLVWEAADRGLPVTVHRLGLVAGSSETGACSREEIFVRYLQGLPRLGVYPELPGDVSFEVGCVDFCARAMVALGERDDAAGACFHLHAERPSPLHALGAELLLARGEALRPIAYAEWLRLLNDRVVHDRQNPLQPLVPFLAQPWPGTDWTFHETLAHRPPISSTGVRAGAGPLGVPCRTRWRPGASRPRGSRPAAGSPAPAATARS